MTPLEQKLYEALRKIAKDFQTAEQVKRTAQRSLGLEPEEALEMAYENMQGVAKSAIKGIRRPKP